MASKFLICSACQIPIECRQHLTCSACLQTLDLKCAKVPECRFLNTMTKEHKKTWKCQICIRKQKVTYPETSKMKHAPKSKSPAIPTTVSRLDVCYNESSFLELSSHQSLEESQTFEIENVNTKRGGSTMCNDLEATNCFDDISSLAQTPVNKNENTVLTDIMSEIKILKAEVRELRKENSEIVLLRQEVRDLKNEMVQVTTALTKLDSYEKRIELQDKTILEMRESIQTLQLTLQTQEQHELRDELEIVGVPEQNNENLKHIVILSSNKVGVNLNEEDLDLVHRAGPRKPGSQSETQPRSIIVKLARKSKRDEIISAAKSRRNLTTEDITPGPSAKLYINERLSKTNRRLFRETRQRAQKYNFRYTWTRNGTIYVRKTDGKPAIIIRTEADLDSRVGPPCLLVSYPTYP